MKKRPVIIKIEVLNQNAVIEPEGASMIEIIRDVTCDETITVMGAITLNDDNPSHLFAYDKDFEIKSIIRVKFAGDGATKKVIVVKSIYEDC